MKTTQKQYNALKLWFSQRKGVLTALSGGVDSCLVAWAARQSLPREMAVAVIGDSPSLKRSDLRSAIDFCKSNDIVYVIIHPGELDDPNYAGNPVDRCFWCKSSLYLAMNRLQVRDYPDFVMVNGNNVSDLGDYRPGMKAASQYKSYSPLAECGMNKEDIRTMAHEAGLKVWNKPASPCLSSRFPYGTAISREKLALVEKAEEWLSQKGFSDVRVRYLDGRARIEVPASQIEALKGLAAEVSIVFAEIGFSQTEIDEEGLVSGKLNRVLPFKKK